MKEMKANIKQVWISKLSRRSRAELDNNAGLVRVGINIIIEFYGTIRIVWWSQGTGSDQYWLIHNKMNKDQDSMSRLSSMF